MGHKHHLTQAQLYFMQEVQNKSKNVLQAVFF